MPDKPAPYRFSFGPWNVSTGADPFGPAVRKEVPFAKKIREYRELGFTYVQLHDDDVVPADWDATQTAKGVAKVKKMLDGEGLTGGVHRAPPVGGSENDRWRLYGQQGGGPQLRPRSYSPFDRYRPHVGHRLDGALAGRGGNLHSRGQGRRHEYRPACGRDRRHAQVRLVDPYCRRDEAQRADGPGLLSDASATSWDWPIARPIRRGWAY